MKKKRKAAKATPKETPKKPFLDVSFMTLVVTSLILIGAVVSIKYPSLILYEEVEMENAEEVGYSDSFLPPTTVRYWCEDGFSWATLVEGKPVAFVNNGIVPEGRYQGYCHAVSQPDAEVQIYFNQLGSGYLVRISEQGIAEVPFSS